jgi:threonylcarbamoyladenosine tRNA methylthiotransferase MtaB
MHKSSSTNQQVVTFGCRLNIYESEIIKQNLNASGLDDVIVFNTCTVTKEAEKDAKAAIRKAKKSNPNVKIIVTGCAAQKNPEIFESMPEVDKILGNQEKLLPENYNLDNQRILVGDIMSIKETANHLITGFDNKARGFLQVQNGCNHRCTFCIIPFGRGNSRSVPIGVIVEQIKRLLDSDYKEIVFTGVDLTSYGPDLPGEPTFSQMIRRVLNLIPELKRLRLSSIDVAEIDENLFELMAYEERLMPHFHISLQSGDDMILKRMKRRHNRAQVIEFCNKLRNIRDVAFGADIIAGFPTETEQMFQNTKHLISDADLQYLHVFPYSERDGTPAARMPQVEKKIRKARAQELIQCGNLQKKIFFERNLNKSFKVLIEQNNTGHTENFIPVKFNFDVKPNSLIDAVLTSIDKDGKFMNAQQVHSYS